MNAEPVLVPRWYCTYGTRVVVVAAETKDDARALVCGRLRLERHQVGARLLRISDVENLERIAAAQEALTR